MNKTQLLKQFILFGLALFLTLKMQAQCSWRSIVNDGFENTNVIPGLMPGKTVHTTPQTFAAHSGTRSMYMNFVNCNGGAGACAGDKVYERIFAVCPGVSLRFNSWYTTTFSGIQCDVKLVISDANGLVLDSIQNLVAPYAPVWTNYITNTFTSTTNTIVFSMYTNVDGGNGNDLSVDDFKLEHCVNLNSLAGYNVCSNLDSLNLFDVLPNSPVNNGTWQGPSVLGGGYLGTFFPGVSSGGNYIYTSNPYGIDPACPIRVDTIVAVPFPAPVINLIKDTVICTNQTLLISAGTSTSNMYNWNTGATTMSITASTTSSVDTSIIYVVTVTNSGGCSETDSVTVGYIVCSGANEFTGKENYLLFPNPAHDRVYLHSKDYNNKRLQFTIYDASGRIIYNSKITGEKTLFTLPKIESGQYQYVITESDKIQNTGQLIISK